MTWSKTALWICLIALATAVGIKLTGSSGDQNQGGQQLSGAVVEVIDGDTVKVRTANGEVETVRYIGIDTPESKKPGVRVQCFALKAAAANRQLVAGHRVRLVVGTEPRDRYGRLLAYVYRKRDNRFINLTLIRHGFARSLAIAPNIDRASTFKKAERKAKKDNLGLWQMCDR